MTESLLVKSFSDRLTKKVSDKGIRNDVIKYIDSYVDKNSSVLYYPTPYYRLFFRDETERAFIYDKLDMSANEIKDVLKNIPEIKSSWKIATDPFSITMLLTIRESSILFKKTSSTALKREYEAMFSKSLLFLTLSLYSSLQYKYFRFPNEDLMNYTINNVSNKFLFKKYGNVIGALIHTAQVNHETYIKQLQSNNDYDILLYLINLRIRLNNLVQNFKAEYEKNKANGDYLAHDKENNEPENYHENQSVTTTIAKLTDKVMIKFSTGDINLELTKIACEISECEKNTLYNALLAVKDNELEKVREVILNIFVCYFSNNPKDDESDINSKKFLVESLKLFNKSNTKDKSILTIKSILDYFLNTYCERYSKTERAATKINYKKAMFIYFILFIQNSFK
jgi:hypothetical protein